MLCWGRNPVYELLRQSPERVNKILVAANLESSFLQKLERAAGEGGLRLQTAARETLDDLASGGTHQGVVAYVSPPKTLSADDFIEQIRGKDPAMVMALDHIQDPRNLGAICRTAEAAGAKGILLPVDRSVDVTGTAVKTSAGSALRLPIVKVVNLRRSLETLKKEGFWVIGLSGDGEANLFDAPLPERCVLVMGGEGEGLADLTRKTCDQIVSLPMQSPVESLNAGVAASLALYHWAKDFVFGDIISGEAVDDDDAPELSYQIPEPEIKWPEEDNFDDFC